MVLGGLWRYCLNCSSKAWPMVLMTLCAKPSEHSRMWHAGGDREKDIFSYFEILKVTSWLCWSWSRSLRQLTSLIHWIFCYICNIIWCVLKQRRKFSKLKPCCITLQISDMLHSPCPLLMQRKWTASDGVLSPGEDKWIKWDRFDSVLQHTISDSFTSQNTRLSQRRWGIQIITLMQDQFFSNSNWWIHKLKIPIDWRSKCTSSFFYITSYITHFGGFQID